VAQCEEVRLLGESIGHRQDHTLAIDAWEAFDDVESNVQPNLGWNIQGLQEAGGMKVLCLVTLTSDARAHKLAHQPTVVVDEEVMAEALQGLLHPFMVDGVRQCWRCLTHNLTANIYIKYTKVNIKT
jgi:hypothetical protein